MKRSAPLYSADLPTLAYVKHHDLTAVIAQVMMCLQQQTVTMHPIVDIRVSIDTEWFRPRVLISVTFDASHIEVYRDWKRLRLLLTPITEHVERAGQLGFAFIGHWRE